MLMHARCLQKGAFPVVDGRGGARTETVRVLVLMAVLLVGYVLIQRWDVVSLAWRHLLRGSIG